MNEVKIYGSVLAVLLIGAYLSWSREEPTGGSTDQVTLVDAPKNAVRSISLFAKTQTVSFSFKTSDKGSEYPWFVVEQNKRKRSFAGNEKVDKMIESFGPFKALRSLGKLTKEEISEVKLERPERRLVVGLKSGAREFEIGGRTPGARDHYVRPKGGSGEVFLVASTLLGDFEFPESRFMQRKLRDAPLKEVSKVTLSANGRTKTVLHKNRLSPNESFWASEAKPDEKSETLENYVDKLEKLAATEFANEDQPFPRQGTPIVVITWYGEDEATAVGTTEIWRVGEDRQAEYYALSESTRVPVKLSRVGADQIESDLGSVLDE